MFVDKVTLTFTAGRGGNGVVAWRREKYIPKGGPSGGNGGNGGSIILQADTQVVSLEGFRNRKQISADSGMAGGSNLKIGKTGKDLKLKVPCGTLVKDAKTKEILFDFTEDKQEFLLCKGGRGGKGNNCFKSPTNQAPNICTEGTYGQIKGVELELKLIADVGLIGMPNAGKSTLMNKLTHVEVKIGAYPFTTLFPNLSYIQFEDYSRLLIADIPGIIENAHENKGLGLEFLKHIERTSALVFVIDASGFEGRDPLDDFRVLREELKAYNEEMLEKPYLLVLNKSDMEETKEEIVRIRKELSKDSSIDPQSIFEISALSGSGIRPLVEAMRALTLSSALAVN